MAKKSSQLCIDRIILGRLIIAATGYALAHPDNHGAISKIQTLVPRYAAVIPHAWIGALIEGLEKRRSRHTRTIRDLETRWGLILRFLIVLSKNLSRSDDYGKYHNIRLRDFQYLLSIMVLYSLGSRSSIVGTTCASLRVFARRLSRRGRLDITRAIDIHIRLNGHIDPFADSWRSLLKFLKSLSRR